MEHSFYLSQQKVPQPVSSAVQKYNPSNMPAIVQKALEDIFTQYSQASLNEKVDLVLNVITQNRIGELNICLESYLLIPELNEDNNLASESGITSGEGSSWNKGF